MSETSDSSTAHATIRRQLGELSRALLRLHKTLMDCERLSYEKTFGRIDTPNQFLQLLLSDPKFAWLRKLSTLIAAIDHSIDGNEPLPPEEMGALIAQAGRLLKPAEAGDEYARNYHQALQRSPEVIEAHREALRLWAEIVRN